MADSTEWAWKFESNSCGKRYARDFVEIQIERMNECYKKNDHVGTLEASSSSVANLIGRALIAPKTMRDGDEDRWRLEMLAQNLVKLDKATAWLGYHLKYPLMTYRIAIDLRRVYKNLSDDERYSSINSTFAYSWMRKGNFKEAWNFIQAGISEVRSLEGRRAVLDALVSLLIRLEHFEKATYILEECINIDEKLGRSDSSGGYVLFKLGFCEAHLRGSRKAGELKMEEGLDLYRKAASPGFELQIQKMRINYYFQKGEKDRAIYILNEAKNLLEQFPDSYGELRMKINNLAEFIKESDKHKERSKQEKKISYAPLREVMEAAEEQLLERKRRYSAMILLGVALEIITLLICIKNKEQLERNIFEKEMKLRDDLSLTEKNALLYEAGIFDEETKERISDLIKFRNQLFHGRVESGWTKGYASFEKLFELYKWLCFFIEEYDLKDYCPKKAGMYL